MKIKIFLLSVVLIATAIFINSCKKGEDDPWLSLRSRDNRVIGKWKLVEQIEEYVSASTITESNNVNNVVENKTFNDKETNNVLDNILTKTETENDLSVLKSIRLNSPTNSFINIDITSIQNNDKKWVKENSIELEIKEDNTWEAIYRTTDISFLYRFFSKESSTDTIYREYTEEEDTIYSPAKTETRTETGYWYWEDGDKDKILINAGPMQGNIQRLAHKEIIIEEINNITVDSLYHYYESFYTYNDIDDPYKRLAGFGEIQLIKNINTKKYYKWIAND